MASEKKLTAITLLATISIGIAINCNEAYSQDETAIEDFEMSCLEWQYKTARQKFLDGPGMRDVCLNYLEKRTPAKIEEDNKLQQWLIDQAQKEWDAYEKKGDHH